MILSLVQSNLTKAIKWVFCFTFFFSLTANNLILAKSVDTPCALPPIDQHVALSDNHSLPILRGLKLDKNNPLRMEFVVDAFDHSQLSQIEAGRLVRYFLAALTTPQKDYWVNLSPYEASRTIPSSLAQTDLGRDLLAQDYLLKQLTASITYPENEVGQGYWQKIYKDIAQKYWQTNIPVETFNKIWIVPEKAVVHQENGFALIGEAKLKVMLEDDYLASNNNNSAYGDGDISRQVMREVILPKIEDDINNGENFAVLRQIYNAMILAVWFKQSFKDSFYAGYIDQEKVNGIDVVDAAEKEKIFNLYVEAFNKGMYDYTKKEVDPATNRRLKRHYHSGGFSGQKDFVETQEGDGQLSSCLENNPINNPQNLVVDYKPKEVSSTIAWEDRLKTGMEKFYTNIANNPWQAFSVLARNYGSEIESITINRPLPRERAITPCHSLVEFYDEVGGEVFTYSFSMIFKDGGYLSLYYTTGEYGFDPGQFVLETRDMSEAQKSRVENALCRLAEIDVGPVTPKQIAASQNDFEQALSARVGKFRGLLQKDPVEFLDRLELEIGDKLRIGVNNVSYALTPEYVDMVKAQFKLFDSGKHFHIFFDAESSDHSMDLVINFRTINGRVLADKYDRWTTDIEEKLKNGLIAVIDSYPDPDTGALPKGKGAAASSINQFKLEAAQAKADGVGGFAGQDIVVDSSGEDMFLSSSGIDLNLASGLDYEVVAIQGLTVSDVLNKAR